MRGDITPEASLRASLEILPRIAAHNTYYRRLMGLEELRPFQQMWLDRFNEWLEAEASRSEWGHIVLPWAQEHGLRSTR